MKSRSNLEYHALRCQIIVYFRMEFKNSHLIEGRKRTVSTTRLHFERHFNYFKLAKVKMRFSILFITALAAAGPTPGVIADGWFLGPTLLSSFLDDSTPSPFLRSRGASHPPRYYEMVDDDEKFQVAFDVPGLSLGELRVSLEDGGSTIVVSGHRQVSDENYSFTTKFSQSFYLDPSVQVGHLVATLKDDVLVVSAPKDKTKLRETARLIPIKTLDAIESGEPKKDEEVAPPPLLDHSTSISSIGLDAIPSDHTTSTKEHVTKDSIRERAKKLVEPAREIMDHWQTDLRV
jgi:HSP20 family molecular chaperone IbpA